MPEVDLLSLLKRAVELVMPDLRAYYRVVRKARVVKTYASSSGQYWADVQPLRNDESVDASEPVVSRVEIPVIWAGPGRGVICPPVVGAYCDLSYYDGDPNYPRISNFRWYGMGAPSCGTEELVVQKKDGTHIKIDASDNIELESPTVITLQAGATVTLVAPQIDLMGTVVTVKAPQINLMGAITTSSEAGGSGSFVLNGNIQVNGDITATGSITDTAGNTNHHSH